MVVLVEDKMETDEIKQKKRKSFLLDESLEHGKRVKFQSFPKATSKLSVSAAAATLSQDEDVEKLGHFASRLEYWQDLNKTDGFDNFCRSIRNISSKLVFVLHNREELAAKLVEYLDMGEELFLKELYDLTANFAVDIQSEYFIPFFPALMKSMGESLLRVKESPEIVKAGYTAISQIVGMIMRITDQDNGMMSSLEVLQTCLNCLMKDGKSLPQHSHKLCASALGQIIRRSKTKESCIEFMLEKCSKQLDLAGLIFVRALKTTNNAVNINADKTWNVILRNIPICNAFILWSSMINAIAELPTTSIQLLIKSVLDFWKSLDTSSEKSFSAIFDITLKILNLCRGKKISIEKEICHLICHAVEKCDDKNENFLNKLKNLLKLLCSTPSQESMECVSDFVNNSQMNIKEKSTVLDSLAELNCFEKFYMTKITMLLSRSKDPDHALELSQKLFCKFIDAKLRNKTIYDQDPDNETNFVIEFACDRPNSPQTVPNKLVQKLNQVQDEERLEILQCLLAFRPLNQEKTIDALKASLDYALKHKNLDMLYLTLKTQSSLLSHKEFLQIIVDQADILDILSKNLTYQKSCEIIATIFKIAANDPNSNWIQRTILGPLKGQCLISDLIKNLSHIDAKVRFWTLKSLSIVFPNVQVYQVMLNVEATQPHFQHYRDRSNYLTNLSWDNPIVQDIKDEDISIGIFKFLLSQLSLNFKLLWEPTFQVLETHDANKTSDLLWTSWYDLFKTSNATKETEFYRNQLLDALARCPGLLKSAEKNHLLICHEFLEVFMKESKSGPGLFSYLKVFGKFTNLQSMVHFEQVKLIAQKSLGHYIAKTREAALGFFCAAYKDLRCHRDVLIKLLDAKNWKHALLALPDQILHSDSMKVKNMLDLILISKLKETSREKRTAQLSARKYLVRIIFQLFGLSRGIEFLEFFVKQETPMDDLDENANDHVKKLAMIFDILIISAQSAGGAKQVFKSLLEVLQLEGELLQKSQKKEPLLLSKQRSKLMEHLLLAFQTLKDVQWSPEDEYIILEKCVWPILNPVTSSSGEEAETAEGEDKIHHLAKIPDLFQCWISNYDRYIHLFFQEFSAVDSENKNLVAEWIVDAVLTSQKIETAFRERVLGLTCSLVIKLMENESEFQAKASSCLYLPLHQTLQKWLTKKIHMDKESVDKLKTLTIIVKSSFLPKEDLDFYSKKIFELAPKWKGEIQTEALVLLNALSGQVQHQVPLSSYKLLSSINGRDGRNLAAQLLWKSLKQSADNPIRLNDNLLLQEEYKKLFEAQDSWSMVNFLYIFHFAASEVTLSQAEFAERNAAATCLRTIVRLAKDQLDTEEYKKLVDTDMVPALSKGLMAKYDRVQAEFILVLTEAMTEDGHLGSITDLHHLQSEDKNEDDTNFFDNMRHIQKHRRGRAMRRLVKQLDELSVDTCQKIIIPLVRTYIFNEEYVQQTEIFNSAVTAIGGLAGKLPWKLYHKLLQQYLSQKPLEPAFQKQRVKVLAAILNNYHFTDEATMSKAKAMMEKLLRRKSTTGSTFFKDGVEEKQSGDLGLYVPIMKILMLLPQEELNMHISTLIVTVASTLKSRKLEERQLARGILCEMAAVLGPEYFPHMIGVLKAQLQRGYQVHILVYSTHAILSHLLANTDQSLQDGALDVAIDPIMHMVNDELFANLMEEKKVAALVKKTAEAKKTVSHHMLELLSTHMSKSMISPMLSKLMNSFKNNHNSNFESTAKLNKALRSILSGLLKNTQLSRPDLIQLGYGLLAGKLLTIKHKSLEELAFGLLYEAANPGRSFQPLKAEEVQGLMAFMVEGLGSKDIGTSTACLKFMVAVTEQSEAVAEALLAFADFIELVWKRCQLYQRIRHGQSYASACRALYNLIRHSSAYQFSTDRLKTMCLFFKGALEESSDDKSAMQLIGLLLFKHYREEALEPYLKLLCSSGLRCRDEATFEVSKKLLEKIVKRHPACLVPALSFYGVNIDIVDERARMRAASMCSFLVEKGPNLGKKYDSKGLFLHSVATYFEEESDKCKSQLESLIKILCIRHGEKEKIDSAVHHLVMDWLGSDEVIHVGIGCKVLSLILEDDKVSLEVARKRYPGGDGSKFLKRPLELIDEDEVNAQYGVAITYGLQLLRSLYCSSEAQLVKAAVPRADKLANLLLHSCVNVRQEAVKLFAQVLSNSNQDQFDLQWIDMKVMKQVMDNVCEIIRAEPPGAPDNLDLVDCLTFLALAILKLGKGPKATKGLLKKTRYFFNHENVNLPQEWVRRGLYYSWVQKVLRNIEISSLSNKSEQEWENATIFVNMIQKNVVRDRKQPQLEEPATEVQILCEKWLEKSKSKQNINQ